MNIPIENVIAEKDKKRRNKELQLYLLISLIIVISLFSLYYIRKEYKKKYHNQDQLIQKKVAETDILKNKLTLNTEGLIKLARKNDPFFLTRFKDLYPDFFEKLKTL
ncbi:hypothetical protein SB768_31545, partial [Burkholderia sp. SIMBA_043]|uniref:hypothetical protein n=1 Tax=Burkholderia sp. SIMBA_043 TaxID=3085784 RepID=UPI0039799F6C